MLRRHVVAAAVSVPLIFLSGLPAYGQVIDLNDAINKAGRQRMLSQRMGKAWLALVHGIEKTRAQQVLDKSMALFDRQLVELKAFAPNAAIKLTYAQLELAWSDYKSVLVGKIPDKSLTAVLLEQDALVLTLAHQGTMQYETNLAKPVGRLVNLAGRQRMLSQRMAKFYLAARLQVETATANAEIIKARTEFVSAMEVLRNAPEATQRIKDELKLADAQWLFLDTALPKLQDSQKGNKSLSDVFVTSENLLSVMDNVTGLYSAIKA